ncbi:MAG: Crp/Fnr family transcriptional regulator [Propionicimonas sp.]
MVVEGTFGHASRSLQLLMEAYAGARLPEWQTFAATLKLVRLAPGETLFRAGDEHPFIYLVHNGLTRAVVTTPSGHQTTVFFSEEGDFLASMTSLAPRAARRLYERGLHPRLDDLKPAVDGMSLHTVSAIEPTVLMRADFRAVDQLAQRHHAWALLTSAIGTLYAMTQQADLIWVRDTPEDRYRNLLQERPNLISRLTQRDLAGYLNVTETTMSRIAKRVRHEPEAHRQLAPELGSAVS